jgi:hypothetical protein
MRPMRSNHMPRNRMADIRFRDGRRWVKVYRDRAWNVAVEEARKRSTLGTIFYAISLMVENRARLLRSAVGTS